MDQEALQHLYQDGCHHITAADGDDEDFEKWLNETSGKLANMVQQVWDEKGVPDGTIDKDVTAAVAQRLWKGAETGYGMDIGQADFDTPDYDMLAALQKNVWHFSAAKNYTQLVQLSKALVDEEGRLRSFNEFKQAAAGINDTFIVQHLKTEYNLAIAGATMAAKWASYPDDAVLQFDAVIDGHTTELCYDLNGTVLPKAHPFWDIYYPPNHFNCRSTTRQVFGRTVTPNGKIAYIAIPDMFQVNLAKHGLLYPPGHAYYKDCPADIFKEAEKLMPQKKE